MKRLLAVLLLLFPGSALAKPVISQADLSGTINQARVDLVLTGAPPFHLLYLSNPYRIAIDMDATDWHAAPVSSSATEELVTGLRHGVQKTGVSRLVLDLSAPARISAARYHTDKDAKTHLIIDLQAVSAANFQQAIDRNQPASPMAECQTIDQKPVMQKTIDGKMVEAAASMTTAAGGPSAAKAPQKIQQAKAKRSSTGQDNAANTVAKAKQAYPEPLLTSLDSDLAHAQQASSEDTLPGFSSPDGYYVSYMHPPGSLLGAGVTVGMQF